MMMPRPALRDRGIFLMQRLAPLGLLLALTALCYVQGLHGPFLLDDPSNILLPIRAWLGGKTGWTEVVFGNGSGLLHRPIANLTFALNALLAGGLDPFPFKATNLVIHLGCGAVLFAFLRELLSKDPQFTNRATQTAFLVTAIWLLHPMQVSTVLYVVQRMAQLGALFSLVALLIYIRARSLPPEQAGKAKFLLFFAVPLAVAAATLSKENGALAPVLCLVVEVCYRSGWSPSTRKPAQLFFIIFLTLPALGALIWLGLLGRQLDYSLRDFTLTERLLSQPRALFSYIHALLLPHGPLLGIYTDDFKPSRGLLSPPTTLLSIFALAALIGVAIAVRRRKPAFAAGVGLYLAGHLLESTIWPLELYFEHRNYLPSIGIFLAATSVITSGIDLASRRSANPVRLRWIIRGGIAACLLMLAAATFFRVGIWRSSDLIAAQGVEQHPESLRANLDHAQALQLRGDLQGAASVFERMSSSHRPVLRNVGIVDAVTLDCMANHAVRSSQLDLIQKLEGSRLGIPEMLAFENLAEYLYSHQCEGLAPAVLAQKMIDIVDASNQAPGLLPVWRMRFIAARLYATAGDARSAQTQAALAWMPGTADTAVGVFLAGLYYSTGDYRSAQLVVRDAERRLSRLDQRNILLIGQLKSALLRRCRNDACAQ